MKTIWKRLKAKTPKFFKRVRAIGLSITGSAIGGLFYKDQIHPLVAEYLSHALTVGVVLTFFASLPVDNPEDIKQLDKPSNL